MKRRKVVPFYFSNEEHEMVMRALSVITTKLDKNGNKIKLGPAMSQICQEWLMYKQEGK